MSVKYCVGQPQNQIQNDQIASHKEASLLDKKICTHVYSFSSFSLATSSDYRQPPFTATAMTILMMKKKKKKRGKAVKILHSVVFRRRLHHLVPLVSAVVGCLIFLLAVFSFLIPPINDNSSVFIHSYSFIYLVNC